MLEGIKQSLAEMLAQWLPTASHSIGDSRREPPSLMPMLTAEKIAGILSAAEAGQTKELFALYRDVLVADNHLQGELAKRLLAVLGDTYTIQAADPNKAEDKKAADLCREQVEGLPNFIDTCAHLLKSSLWPVSLAQKTYRVSRKPGLIFDIASFNQVPDVLLDFSEGRMRIELCDAQNGTPTGQYIFPEPERYITHRGHLLSTPDNWGGPMRSLIYWFFLGVMDREWWARFLDKFATPFFLGKFDRNDNKSRAVLERAFKLSTKIGGIVVNRETQVELVQAATGQTGEAFERFHAVCNREKSKLIVGQTLSAEAQSTGLGSGVSKLQGDVRGDIRQWDAMKLSATLREQLFIPFLRMNGLAGNVTITWGGEEAEDSKTTAEALASLKNAGLRLADTGLESLSKRFGLPIERDDAAAAPVVPGLPAPSKKTAAFSLLNAPEADVLRAIDSIARAGAAGVARDLREHLAALSADALRSDSPEAARAALLHIGVTDAESFEAALLAGAFNAAV